MTRSVTVTPDAEDDMAAIYAYIAADNPPAAMRVIDAVWTTFDALAKSPYSGRPADVVAPALRELRQRQVRRFSNYMVYYRVLPDAIEIVRVRHGAQDNQRIIEQI